jgi:phosphohistidine swiveling domain-containing protein
MKWFVYTRGIVRLHRLAIPMAAVHDMASKLNGTRFEDILFIDKDSKLWFAWNDEDIRNVGAKILKKCAAARGQEEHFSTMKKLMDQANKAAEEVRQMDLKKISFIKLREVYDYLYQESTPAHALMNSDIDAVDIVFEDFLIKKIKYNLKSRINEIEFVEIYKKLATPIYQSYITNEEKGIIRLALKKKFEAKELKELCEKFWWTGLGWENVNPKQEDYFKKMVEKFKKADDLQNKLNKINSQTDKIRKQRQVLIKQYNLSKEVVCWLKVFDRYSYFHDLRKEMQVRVVYSFHLITSEIARRLKINKNDIEWLWPTEMRALIENKKFNQSEIERRKKAVFVRVSEKGIKILSGQAAIRQHKIELPEEKRDIEEFRGMGVSMGKVRGMVKVCSGAAEALKKVKKGEILVTGMTLPDYVPAMKRAAAVITDEGGITCHAAIISRELGIPAVVGTKIATQVLKDGDLVEVDASRGIVKIIK